MDILLDLRKNYKIIIFTMISSLIALLLLRKSIGIKDSLMFSAALFLLIIEIYYSFKDIKKSILLYIISFPILVTARKVFYFDLFLFRLNFESVYIIFITIFNIKEISKVIKFKLMEKKSLEFKFIMLIIIFIIFAYNSSFYSDHIIKSLSSVFLSVVIPVMFMLNILTFFNHKDIDDITNAFIIGISFSSLYGFAQIYMSKVPFSMIRSNRSLFTFGYHNVNIYASILLTILPFLMDRVLYRKNSKKEKIFLYSTLLINLGGLFITYTRGAWICFLIASFIILLSKKYEKLVYVLTALGLLASRWMIPFILHRGQVQVEFFRNESMVARIQSILTSFSIMVKYPFGIGGDNFLAKYREFAIKGYYLLPEDFRAQTAIANYSLELAHNLWLQIGVDFGIISVIVFTLIVINRLKFSMRNYALNRGAFTSIIIYSIYSVTTGIQFNHKGVVTGTLIIWAVFAIISLNNKGVKEELDKV